MQIWSFLFFIFSRQRCAALISTSTKHNARCLLSLLASAGFDHDVLIWNPHVENIIARLNGHSSALIGVKMSERSPEILSASNDGVIKVWDIRTFKCCQTIICEAAAAAANLTDFTYFESNTHGMMIVGSKTSLHLFENEPEKNPVITDVDLTTDVAFQESTCSFITAAGSGIKIWDARTGLLIKDYENIIEPTNNVLHNAAAATTNDEPSKFKRGVTPQSKRPSALPAREGGSDDAATNKYEITAISLDWTGKKVVIGTAGGQLSLWLIGNMTKLHNLQRHSGEVTKIKVFNLRQYILSSSYDGTVKLHIIKETGPECIGTISHVSSFRRLNEVKKQWSGEQPRPPSPAGGIPRAATRAAGGRRKSISTMLARRNSTGGPLDPQELALLRLIDVNTDEEANAAAAASISTASKRGRQNDKVLAEEKIREEAMALSNNKMMKDKANWEVKHMKISGSLGQFATASLNPVILIWDVYSTSHTRPLGQLVGHKR